MRNEKLFSEYIKHSKVLLSTLNIDEKTIEVFDSEGNKKYNYQDFFLFVSSYFDLIPDFVDKSIVVVETIDPKNELLEISNTLGLELSEPITKKEIKNAILEAQK